ncbi:uncharacterized protein LOC127859663 isoform X1 [Dreissena polymorpha]|uniref:uncharacterized protein LOC127859663 isoform X1 n=1 Tax=Dreissena polymorpha TaxID=45954 RepID=UPI0022645B7A|nr:uncharacterized protein LOC127859663 isoform X1 [Dreissena polymorpha]
MATKEDTPVLQKGSDALFDYCCCVCDDNASLTEAHFYCESCCKWYCDQCVSLHGQMYKKHTTLGKMEQVKWPVARGVAELLTKCEEHKGKTIEMFCADHSHLCCTTCVLLDHRKCNKVTQITSGEHKKEHDDLQKLTTDINSLTQRLRKLIEQKEDNVRSLQCEYDNIIEEITLVREKFNAALDLLVQRTINEGREVVARLQKSLQADVFLGKAALKRIQSLQDASDKIAPHDSELSTVAFMKIENELLTSDSILREIDSKSDFTLSFTLDKNIENCLATMTTLGTINTSNRSTVIATIRNSRYNIKLSGEETCEIRCICEMPNGNVIIADAKNNKIKILDKHFHVVSYCDIPAHPFYVCQITDAEVAVAVYNWVSVQEIHILALKNDTMVEKEIFKLTHPCTGIRHYNGHLYVTSKQALYRYTMTGMLLDKMYEDTSGSHTVYRFALNANVDRIYVLDLTNHKVLTLNMSGQFLASFTDPELKQPIDVHVTESGQVLVCGHTSQNIIQLNSEGT